jgi:hypothetical protein
MHQLKKLVLAVTVVLLLANIFFSDNNSARALATVALSVDPVNFTAHTSGERFYIQVRIYNATNITGYMFKLHFNQTFLACVKTEVGTLFPPFPNSTMPVAKFDNNQGIVSTQSRAGDINKDGVVDLRDLVILAKAYGSKPGDTKWNPDADIDGNSVGVVGFVVGLSDLVFLAANYKRVNVLVSGQGVLLKMTFEAIYASKYGSPYPYAKDSCRLEILNDTVYGPGQTDTISPITVNGTYNSPYNPPLALNLTFNPDQTTYHFEDKINITGFLIGDGYLVIDSLVALEILNPRNNPVALRTLPTGATPVPRDIMITGLTACDSNGISTDTFDANAPNAIAYFLVTVKNSGSNSLNARVIVNPYDSSNASLGVVSFQVSVPSGGSITVKSPGVPLDSRAVSGNAMVYSSVLSAFVESGGQALSLEKSATFKIASFTSGQTILADPVPGTYQTILRLRDSLQPGALDGNYIIWAATSYMGNNATQTKQVWMARSP